MGFFTSLKELFATKKLSFRGMFRPFNKWSKPHCFWYELHKVNQKPVVSGFQINIGPFSLIADNKVRPEMVLQIN